MQEEEILIKEEMLADREEIVAKENKPVSNFKECGEVFEECGETYEIEEKLGKTIDTTIYTKDRNCKIQVPKRISPHKKTSPRKLKRVPNKPQPEIQEYLTPHERRYPLWLRSFVSKIPVFGFIYKEWFEKYKNEQLKRDIESLYKIFCQEDYRKSFLVCGTNPLLDEKGEIKKCLK